VAEDVAQDVAQDAAQGAAQWIERLAARAEREAAADFRAVAAIERQNHARVAAAFLGRRLGRDCLSFSGGYGYGDPGRAAIDAIYAELFGAEAALVRPHIATGTQAVALGLYAATRPGQGLVAATGRLYHTLRPVIESLVALGVTCSEVALGPDGRPDLNELRRAVGPGTSAVFAQRSGGYEWRRPALRLDDIAAIAAAVHEENPGVAVVVDNCYGEFTADREPPAVGADLAAGSLLKNPGGGLAPTGGYVAGRRDLVARASARLFAPGQEAGIGPLLDAARWMLQGAYVAPHVVAEALRAAHLAARLFAALGFPVSPRPGEPRGDLVQAIRLGSERAVLAFCRGVQRAGPLEPHARPEAADLPGYDVPVVMAGGSFVPGSSSEFSADAPLVEPYCVFVQGGLTYEHARLALLCAARELAREGLLPPR
jgi:cystathionine beta-lyase family protein involved in aluminum resistance